MKQLLVVNFGVGYCDNDIGDHVTPDNFTVIDRVHLVPVVSLVKLVRKFTIMPVPDK